MEQQQNDDDVNALEVGNESSSATSVQDSKKSDAPKKGLNKKVRGLISRLNVYVLLFILIMVLVAGITFVGYKNSQKEGALPTIETQELTADDLKQLSGSDATVGDPKQTLTIASNALFNGKVLIRDSLDVAGTIKVGGSLSLPGLNVAGTSTFDQIQANSVSVSGDANVQGQFTIQKGLTVSGGASFGGAISTPQITVQSFQLNGDLQLNRHIDAGGPTPSKSDGGALGSGGTSSVSGTDTAGTVTINTGGSAPAGCFITVTFRASFNAAPHVVITPNDSDAAGLNYYVTRNSASFTICTTSNPPDGANFGFDYIAID